MMSRKRMLSGKRMLAGILTAVMVVSSAQLPMSAVYAEEIAASGQEDENGNSKQESGEDSSSTDNTDVGDSGENEEEDVEDSSQSDDTANGENSADEETGEPSDGEDMSDAQEPSEEENPPAEEDAAGEDGEDEGEESDTEEFYVTGISDNDLANSELQEIMAEDELEGVYQFGGAPSEKGNLSAFSVSAQSDEVEEYLYQQMLKRNTEIDVSIYEIPVDDLGDLISGVLNEHPDLYFVQKSYSISYDETSLYLISIFLTYDDTLNDTAVQSGISTALATVDESMSDLEKAIVLHDYLVVNCEYDKENLDAGTVPAESHTIYGVFAKRTAVCDGYALAYKYLLSRVGIDCYMVTSDSINHAWNMIVLDGQYYQVDVTWDDPTWDMIGRAAHTYMFRSDANFDPADAVDKHIGGRVTYGSETVNYQATDMRYDSAFWTECDSSLVLVGNDCYYVSSEGSLKKTNLSAVTNKGTVVQSIGRWPTWGGGGTWGGSYSGLFRIDDRLYYNDTSSIYSIAMDGTDKRTEFTADTSTGYIYGSAYYQGNVLYALHQTPNLSAKETVLVAALEGSDPVDIPVQRVELSAYTLELAEGEEAELTATVYPTFATDSAVTWTCDDETVATVDNGMVRAIAVGSCTITATAGDKKAECIVQITAKEDNGALNLDNLSYEYTALDDTKISSAADGKPKLLIFYSNGCGNSRNTIKGISSKIDKFAGIDVYAIETNLGTKEEVAEFQATYGCEGITFSYDVTYGNQNSMWTYARAGEISASGTITWPVICYIDADNRLQYITMSYIAADEVLSNLKEYCNAAVEAPQIYTITYVLNGGTNSVFNPSTYTSESDTIILGSATRDGYRFEGWYKDAACTVRVTQIVKGSTGNITLYAKWSPKSSTDLPEIDMTPAPGNVVMGFSGAYYTETADKILERLNAIRLEACKEGVTNPLTKQPLTESDYVPLVWSSDLEAIARLRAAEATVNQDHTRPNGQSCFSVKTTNGEQSWAENLAWNYSGLMEGIEQWYGEKSDWVKQTQGTVTGHYTSIINPSYQQVAVGAFRLSSGGWYAVAQEFSYKSTLDEQKNTDHGSCVQHMEVQGNNVTKLVYSENTTAFLQEGDSCLLPVNVTVQYNDYYGNAKSFAGPYQAGGSWNSSDETVAVVDDMGNVTALGKGTAEISMSAGTKSVSTQITVYGRDESPIVVKCPNITTYKVGQKINLTGGTVTYPSGSQTKTVTLTAAMISGFDSTKPGICAVQVTCGGYTTSFDTLIVEEPKLTAAVGQRLSEIALPRNEYGTYTWQNSSAIMEKAGIYTFTAEFTPNDATKFQKLTDIQVQVTAQETLGTDTDVTFKTNSFTYNGTEQEPKVVVRASDTMLTEGQDYTLSYSNNRNAGIATVTIDGVGCYIGSISRTFEIEPAQLVITAQDKAILIGEPVPAANEYKYGVNGLMTDDFLITEPAVLCGIESSAEAGQYEIVPFGADAGGNYIISYVNGRLTVASEYVSCTVTFDVQGHGTAPENLIDVKVGSTINRPADPTETGYRFDGWYRDAACTKVWNFDSDIVESDMTLYAKWLGGSVDGAFTFQEIADVYYTGKVCKPAVSVYDGDTLLKLGKDYQIKYYNNTNANNNGVRKQGNGEGVYFNADLPYVEIIGKGNYTDRIKDGNKDTVKVNFNILRASIGDGSSQVADGIVLKVTDQLATAKKAQKPFASIKYVKGMKKDTDFNVTLTVENARDQSGRSLQKGLELEDAAVPVGYSGKFLLTVEGIGNYEGSICREIYVADKAHLIKNAKITIGKNLKNITFTGGPVQLKPAETDSADTFSVKYGKTFLKPGRDYMVSYRNHDRVGKAELIITGMGEYAGSKTTTFNIKGRSFTAKTVLVEDLEDKVYTGRAITQNGVKLSYSTGDEALQPLRYGTDYTISYSKNINKGTATMTFKSVTNAGYSGSFRKTFKITAADITQVKRSETMQSMVFNYCKAGVKPVNEILLTNQEGIILQNGKDYTLKYANNKAVAKASGDKPPTVTVKGKGNYVGEFDVTFQIVESDLKQAVDDGDIQIKTTAIAYNPNKVEDYIYKPAVKLMDGKSALRAGTDYAIEYQNNTQADYERYLQNLRNHISTEGDMPVAVITEAEGSSYRLENQIIVPLPIYEVKLTKANLSVEVDEAVYTGNQLTPEVTVSFGGKTLSKGEDYSLSYGANTASGKNKGSVVITGIAPNYGGSVTVKFNITQKPISY
ncbi:MAG: InlB B-repeat-containing protein [Lachnospiraceae bacterium]|nr:InlB B-repeat-containing protein [Lachnospiraceae bacterium]